MSHSDSTVVRSRYSFTSRHLAEFWMIGAPHYDTVVSLALAPLPLIFSYKSEKSLSGAEPELVFADLNDDMRLAEDYVRYCCQVSGATREGGRRRERERVDSYPNELQHRAAGNG